ncbi:hypothetical protein PAXINDRAFT_157320 [Paxillus involutus ATCC 200175]|uniref:CCHC-type domain-containing protein n=1 Tax=Paxillus involutus ATCC 200175 TaxID=664439 RepID=A0A0C9TVQ3_PAXIN|nr:hypothetical protein PAXINDRAFT_157320 [Paxillus involutus ATCC 200175]
MYQNLLIETQSTSKAESVVCPTPLTHPKVRFWKQSQFNTFILLPEGAVAKLGPLPYLKTEDGEPIGCESIKAIQQTLCGTWTELANQGTKHGTAVTTTLMSTPSSNAFTCSLLNPLTSSKYTQNMYLAQPTQQTNLPAGDMVPNPFFGETPSPSYTITVTISITPAPPVHPTGPMVLGSGRPTTSGVGNGATSCSPTPNATTRKTTRCTAQETPKTRAEIATMEQYKVQDAKSGAAYLNKSLLSVVGESFTIEHLATMLFHISQMDTIPLMAIEAIRAVAFLLEDDAASQIAAIMTAHITDLASKEIASQVITAIAPHVLKTSESLHENVEEIKQLQTSISSNSNPNAINIQVSIERVEEATDAILSSLEDVKNVVTLLNPSLEATQNCINSLVAKTTESPPLPHAQTQLQPTSYSAAVKATTSSNHPVSAALARAAIQDHQIFLEPQQGQPLFTADQSTNDIAETMKMVLDNIHQDDAPPLIIKALSKMKNGGLIIEFDSYPSAQWLRQDEIRDTFLMMLGTSAEFKERIYSILIPFLPVSSQIYEDKWIRAIEVENDLPIHAIRSTRWIKPIEKRSPGQRVAHAIFQLNSPQAVNILLRDGLYICKDKLHPMKDKREPIRCACCQKWGHIARDCKATHDTCATPANNPHCPTYERKCEELDAKHPENSMPYFPTIEEWTQTGPAEGGSQSAPGKAPASHVHPSRSGNIHSTPHPPSQ